MSRLGEWLLQKKKPIPGPNEDYVRNAPGPQCLILKIKVVVCPSTPKRKYLFNAKGATFPISHLHMTPPCKVSRFIIGRVQWSWAESSSERQCVSPVCATDPLENLTTGNLLTLGTGRLWVNNTESRGPILQAHTKPDARFWAHSWHPMTVSCLETTLSAKLQRFDTIVEFIILWSLSLHIRSKFLPLRCENYWIKIFGFATGLFDTACISTQCNSTEISRVVF